MKFIKVLVFLLPILLCSSIYAQEEQSFTDRDYVFFVDGEDFDEAYEDDRNEFNAGGNYGAKEDGLKDLDAMLHYNYKLIKYIKETATSPEEQEIVRKHFNKAKELMNV